MTQVGAVPTASLVGLSVFEDFTYADVSDPASPAAVDPRDHQATDLATLFHDLRTVGEALLPLRREACAALVPAGGADYAHRVDGAVA